MMEVARLPAARRFLGVRAMSSSPLSSHSSQPSFKNGTPRVVLRKMSIENTENISLHGREHSNIPHKWESVYEGKKQY